jgi:hypothetical protein
MLKTRQARLFVRQPPRQHHTLAPQRAHKTRIQVSTRRHRRRRPELAHQRVKRAQEYARQRQPHEPRDGHEHPGGVEWG